MTDIAALDQAHVWHPYTQHGLHPVALSMSSGRDALLYTTSGQPIVDAISSWWVTLHGHANPVIAEAIARQAQNLEQVIFAGFTHEPAAALAGELVARLPAGLTRVFYSDNGSTAVEVAIKIALQYWQNRKQRRPLIAAMEHAYHGDTFGAMSASASCMFTAPFADYLFDVVRLPGPTDDSDNSTLLTALDRLLDARGPDLAALIVEPRLQGAGGMRMWDADTLRAIRARTTAHDVLLIADEVLTGFGRTGPLFACEGAGITPDIICLSKGLTGGFLPLGATVVREPLFEAFRSDDRRMTFFHGHSFTANPLACAAARASLSLLDAACAAKRTDLEAAHRRHLARIGRHGWVHHPRVLGTIGAFDLAPPEGANENDRGYLAPIGRELATFALSQGVLLRPLGNVVYAMPPYSITPDQLALVYDVIDHFLDNLDRSAVTTGHAGREAAVAQ